jgi:hypothetical protein
MGLAASEYEANGAILLPIRPSDGPHALADVNLADIYSIQLF